MSAEYAVMVYTVNDGTSPPETRRELVSYKATVGELMEWLSNATHVPSGMVELQLALDGEWGSDDD